MLRAKDHTNPNLPTNEALEAMADFARGRTVPVPVLGADGSTVVGHQYLAGPANRVRQQVLLR